MDKMRKAFEHWARGELGWGSGDFVRSENTYRHSCTQYAWEIWQAALTPSPWIPCSERLPTEAGLPYIVCNRRRQVMEATFVPFDSGSPLWVYDGGTMNEADVTHWMPMPEPPEVEG